MLHVILMAMAAGDVLLLLDEMEESIRRIVSLETERGVDYGVSFGGGDTFAKCPYSFRFAPNGRWGDFIDGCCRNLQLD